MWPGNRSESSRKRLEHMCLAHLDQPPAPGPVLPQREMGFYGADLRLRDGERKLLTEQMAASAAGQRGPSSAQERLLSPMRQQEVRTDKEVKVEGKRYTATGSDPKA
ncbi:hypothetical protein EYF80_031464 [Liparis tanakae]|uniref:Uncharacterized protein n=1 Tax=Liparis tanakae TaxID=230148 RepID=A0A4Z2H0D4_9TELE|nr:hypothetical protein EYF80_031464 [Liparis tanakae]